MKKIFSVFVLSLTLGTSSLCATESIKIQSPSMQNTALTQAEMAFLFDSSDVNVITLSDEEMALTQGEGFFAILAASFLKNAIMGAGIWGICKLTGESGCRFSSHGKAPF